MSGRRTETRCSFSRCRSKVSPECQIAGIAIADMTSPVLDLLKELFQTKSDYEYEVLDGSTPNEERMERCDRFNDPTSEVFVFLLSTRAGGVGLNLTAANRVVIFDPNWNPSHDLQAMDRSYRFGQQRDVYVYRLIGAGTLEELILNRQQYKRALAGVAYDADATRRLYQGVEGDKSQRGELYGVRVSMEILDSVLTLD